ARRLLDDPVLERRRLHAGELEVAVGPVGAPLERGAEDAIQSAPREAEAVEDEALGRGGLHPGNASRGVPRAPPWLMRMDRRGSAGHTSSLSRWALPRVAGCSRTCCRFSIARDR